ncbi:MAG: hypothetical protein HZB71_10195 [Betaproteobacteria bacterium]|nr:hypothetical protein [Betaproteobacteria bacterium]
MTDADKEIHHQEEESGLFDIFNFIADHWKIVIGIGIAGAALLGSYQSLIVPQYEANALVEMAQIRSSNSNTNPPVSVEPPGLLIQRLKIPTTYSPEAIKECGFGNQQNSAESMVGLVKVTLPNNQTPIVNISVRRSSPDLAKQCVRAVFEMIRAQQAELLKPYRDELKTTLGTLRARLRENQAFMSKAQKTGLYQTIYLARRDEWIYLTQKIDELERASELGGDARLMAPIYAPSEPVPAKRNLYLVIGLFAGIFLGVVIVLFRKLLLDWRANRGTAA